MTIGTVQRLQLLAQPIGTLAAAPVGMPLALTAQCKAVHRVGDTWLPSVSVSRRAGDCPPVRYSARITDPIGRQTNLLPEVQIPEALPPGYSSGLFAIGTGDTGGYVFRAGDIAGQYRFDFQAVDASGNVVGSASCSTNFIGSGMNTQVVATLQMSSPIVSINNTLAGMVRLRNISGSGAVVKLAIVAQYVGAGGSPDLVYVLTPPEQTAATGLGVGYDQEIPLTWQWRDPWPRWCELPHRFTEADRRGNYIYGVAVYDWSSPPENPDDWASQPLLSYAVASVGYNDMAHAAGVPNLDHVVLHHREQLDVDDLDAITRAQIESGGFFLGLMTGFTDWLKGGDLTVDHNGDVFMGPLYGWQFRELVVPGGAWERGNPDDPYHPDFQRGDLRRYGSYPLLQLHPSLYVDNVVDHGLPDSGVRYDAICLESVAEEGGAVRDPITGEYPAGDVRLFVDPTNPQSDGRPGMETATVATRRRIVSEPRWVPGYPDPVQTLAMPLPAGYTPVGYVEVSADGNHRTFNLPYPAATVQEHRSATPIDHPDGSIHARHLADVISGGYQQGVDLTLRLMSQSIINARGNFAGEDGLNQRISGVIDADGSPVQSAFDAGIRSALRDMFSSITDARNNLLPSAVRAAMAGHASYVKVSSGQVKHGAQIPRIAGFGDEEQFSIVSIGHLAYNFGAVTAGITVLELHCFIEGWRCQCYSKAHADYVGEGIDGGMPITVPGIANYLTIAIRQVDN